MMFDMQAQEAVERGERIERAIDRSGILSQADAADMCGVSQQALNNGAESAC
jgi:DeoR/GlpR family transcriptional regulator of sugar metabolism